MFRTNTWLKEMGSRSVRCVDTFITLRHVRRRRRQQ